MIIAFKKLIYLLKSNERKKMYLLISMMLIMALLDMIGVASILPFMLVLTNPGLVETNIFLNKLFEISSLFGIENKQQFLFVLGGGVLALLIISLSFKAFTTYAQVRFVQMCNFSVGKRLIEGYLHQPYSWFLNRNSSDIGKIVLSEVGQVISNGLSPFMNLISTSMVSIMLVSLLILADPKLTLIIALVLSLSYGLIFFLTRTYLNKNGKERLVNNKLRFKAVSEAFGAAKEVKVSGLEQIYTMKFSHPSKIIARNLALAASISQLPRYFLEAIAFGGILLLILYLMGQTESLSSALPIISLYVLCGYRLMPALQQIYSSFSKLVTVGPSLDEMYNDLKNLKSINLNQNQTVLPFYKTITLKNVSYNYPNSEKTTLKNINFSIHSKKTVGLVGPTGSGKTTIVDIILGLLEPQEGVLEVDGKTINKNNSRSWQRSIGYVPQFIYLSDDSIAANIAFGVDQENINQEAIEKASKIANLHNFVINELPFKYETVIGENGVRLSGGQRQRIGIARALYHNPKVLILDEATSALDNKTEEIVMEAVNKLRQDVTIVMIAHRLTTLKNCDLIFRMENGKLVNQGTFEELINNRNNLN